MPPGFSWIESPFLAALAHPEGLEEFCWLREHGIQLLISLTELPPHRPWLEEAGLLSLHVPVPDFHAPTPEQIDQCVTAVNRAKDQQMGVAVHCLGGLGRTGTILACYMVAQGMPPEEAVARVRELRPGSIESDEQEEAVAEYALRRGVGPAP